MTDELILRVLMGRATEAEEASVAAWRSASAANARAYAELERVAADLAAWHTSAPVPPAPPATALVRRAELHRVSSTGRTKIAAAWRGDRWWIARAAALVAIAFGAGAAIAAWRSDRTPALVTASITAGPTGLTPVTLSDGTVIQLAAGSRLHVERRHDRREVTLDGRAEFAVAHLARVPFIVHTAAGDARDLGTRFVVRADGNATDVAVFEGRVALSAQGATIELAAGDVGRAVEGEAPWRTSQGDTRSDDDWLRAALVFNGEPLSEVARTLSERFHYELHFTDSTIAQRTVTAWFVEPPQTHDVVVAICRAVGAACVVGDSTATVATRTP